MDEALRQWLYPLGFISALLFGARFLVQWITSERAGKSVVNRAFWQLSLLGNVALFFHAVLQLQFHVCAIQACNSVMAWRNLNLMEKEERHVRLGVVIGLLVGALAFSVFLFVIQGDTPWFRVPVHLFQWRVPRNVTAGWHFFGTLGLLLFASRFWVQWWQAERQQRSTLEPIFWWLSVVGALFSAVYFARMVDPINSLGPLLSLVPYVRNLMLIKRSRRLCAAG